MLTCHVCTRPWNDHAADCRVREDMDRLGRVHRRLLAEGRQPDLTERIGRYLNLFGHLSCQSHDGPATPEECGKCGNAEFCVIMPAR